ncbi:MAG: cupin domain-containing protein [Pseudomonadota bacterium]
MKVYDWQSVEERRINANITRKMIWGENVMAVKWRLAPNTAIPEHDHVSEQMTIVEEGSITLLFPGEDAVTLLPGQMLMIPSMKRHAVKVGPDGSSAIDIFSPIRRDFIEGKDAYLGGTQDASATPSPVDESQLSIEDGYRKVDAFLRSAGIKTDPDRLKDYSLEELAWLAYERKTISMGQLRELLGITKEEARALIRRWKHGDDHSEYSLQRRKERIVILPGELLGRPKS